MQIVIIPTIQLFVEKQFLLIIIQQIQNIQDKKIKMKNIIQEVKPTLKSNITDYLNNQKNYIKEIRQYIISGIKDFQISFKSDELVLFQITFKSWKQIRTINQIQQKIILVKTVKLVSKYNQIQYITRVQILLNLIIIFKIRFNKLCTYFQTDASILLAGCSSNIKIFEFKQEKLIGAQQLNAYGSSTITTLIFMNKSYQFISGSVDGVLIYWKYNENIKQWEAQQVLKHHTHQILHLEMNKNENKFMSGSSDKAIKFWEKQNNLQNVKQTIMCQGVVWSISLNNQENVLIASLDNNKIFVIQQKVQEWIVIQQISLDGKGYRISFVNDKQFVFQPQNSACLFIYDYDEAQKNIKFRNNQTIKIRNQMDNALFQYVTCKK